MFRSDSSIAGKISNYEPHPTVLADPLLRVQTFFLTNKSVWEFRKVEYMYVPFVLRNSCDHFVIHVFFCAFAFQLNNTCCFTTLKVVKCFRARPFLSPERCMSAPDWRGSSSPTLSVRRCRPKCLLSRRGQLRLCARSVVETGKLLTRSILRRWRYLKTVQRRTAGSVNGELEGISRKALVV
jgi:hypothetical protein